MQFVLFRVCIPVRMTNLIFSALKLIILLKSYQQNLIRIHLLFKDGDDDDDAFLSLSFIYEESRTLLISLLVEGQ